MPARVGPAGVLPAGPDADGGAEGVHPGRPLGDGEGAAGGVGMGRVPGLQRRPEGPRGLCQGPAHQGHLAVRPPEGRRVAVGVGAGPSAAAVRPVPAGHPAAAGTVRRVSGFGRGGVLLQRDVCQTGLAAAQTDVPDVERTWAEGVRVATRQGPAAPPDGGAPSFYAVAFLIDDAKSGRQET